MKWPSVDPGRFRDRVTIERKKSERDSMGGVKEQWEAIAPVPADVQDLTGRELQEAQKQWGEVTAQVFIRYFSGVDETMRLKDHATSEYYDIRGVVDVGGYRHLMQLFCRKRK